MDMSSNYNPTIWVVTEGLTGIPHIIKRITLRQPWKLLSPYLGLESFITFNENLSGPWPDIVIASGRKSIAACRYIKRKSGNKTFTVQIQDPRIPPNQFDMVALPQHDPTRGDNVIVTVATPNRITPNKLKASKDEFAHVFQGLKSERIAVLIGGSTKRYTMTRKDSIDIVKKLIPLDNLMITTSRRTGEDNSKFLKSSLAKNGNYIWDNTSPNPYMGMLAWADVIIVTSDSTSMISEAATTGKPVYVLPMAGLTPRQNQLVENLKSFGAVREFKGKIDHWTYPSLNDSATIAAHIREKCGLFS